MEAGAMEAEAIEAGGMEAEGMEARAMEVVAIEAEAMEAGAMGAEAMEAEAMEAEAMEAGEMEAGTTESVERMVTTMAGAVVEGAMEPELMQEDTVAGSRWRWRSIASRVAQGGTGERDPRSCAPTTHGRR